MPTTQPPDQHRDQGQSEQNEAERLHHSVSLQRLGEQLGGQTGGPVGLDHAGCAGALADRRLRDAQARARVGMGQPLGDQVGHLPATLTAPSEQVGPQPQDGLQLFGTVVVAADNAHVRGDLLGARHRLTGMEIGLPATSAPLVGQGRLHLSDANTDVPVATAQQQSEHLDDNLGVVDHALDLVARRTFEGSQGA